MLTIFFIVIAVFIGIGIYAGKYAKDPLSFYIMNRTAPSWLLIGTMTATILSGMTFFGLVGLWYGVGILAGTMTWFGVWLGLPFGVLYVARRVRSVQGVTIQDFFQQRFQSKAVRGIATLILIISLIGYTVGQLMGAGIALSTVTGIPYTWLVVIFAVACIAFLSFGGQYGVTFTDFGMFFFMLLLVFVSGSIIIGQAGGIGAVSSLAQTSPATYTMAGLAGLPSPLLFQLSIIPIWVLYAVASPGYVSRGFPAKSDTEMIKASFITILLFMVIPFFLGWVIMPAVRLLDPNIAVPQASFVTILAEYVPPFWAGLGLAGIMAALLTTASSFLLYLGIGLSRDLYKSIINPNASAKQEMFYARLFQAVGVLICILFAMQDADQLFWILTYANGIFVCGWLPTLIGGFEWKGASKNGALYSMIIGPAVYIIVDFFKIVPTVHPVFWGVGFSIIAFLLVSMISKPTQEETDWFKTFKSQHPGNREIQEILATPGGKKEITNAYHTTRKTVIIATILGVIFFGYFYFAVTTPILSIMSSL